jgi:hypothetical protein
LIDATSGALSLGAPACRPMVKARGAQSIATDYGLEALFWRCLEKG